MENVGATFDPNDIANSVGRGAPSGGSAPSGGGGSPSSGKCGGRIDDGHIFKEIRCQTGCNKQCGRNPTCDSKTSPRLQYGVYNNSPEVDFNVTVKIPCKLGPRVDSANVTGWRRCTSWSVVIQNGYKAYVGINGGDNGIGTENRTR